MASRIGAVMLAGVIAAGATSPAGSAGFFEKNFYMSGPRYSSKVPLCDDSWPLNSIQVNFHTKEYRYWDSELRIVQFENVREIALRPWADATIPRRFCSARVVVSDGSRHAIYYSIIEDASFIGAGWGIEWCVVGLDRNWAYNPACKMARP